MKKIVSQIRPSFEFRFRHARNFALLCTTMVLGACADQKEAQPATTTSLTRASGFDVADANHDGKLSRDEANNYLVNKVFTGVDANHDGVVTRQEATAADPDQAAEFNKRDLNHDGQMTRAEAIKYGQAHGVVNQVMSEADKNHDGSLDQSEVQAYYASREGPAH